VIRKNGAPSRRLNQKAAPVSENASFWKNV
jgi:hypothetical protein